MKTVSDLEKMKNEEIIPYGNAYTYTIDYFEDLYISKLNGIERIRQELKKWDKPAREIIIKEVISSVSKSGIRNFDPNELMDLI